MVWCFQLQQTSGRGIVYAPLPTRPGFIFCQNSIMRGIIVPLEKQGKALP